MVHTHIGHYGIKLHGRRGLKVVKEKMVSSTGDITRQTLFGSMPQNVVFALITF
jgi:hypothetical protein